MATGTDIITNARRRLGIFAEEEPLQAVDGTTGLSLLQSLLGSWVSESSIKAYSAPALASAVTVTIYDDTVLANTDFAITANLAMRLAGSLGLPYPPDLIVDAEMGKGAIVRQHVNAQLENSTFDKGMVYMPSWTLPTLVSEE